MYLAYSVHGNEPSGTGAALMLLYYLASAEGAEIESLLNNTVILLDPCLNPDGLHRFATWVNSQRSLTTVTDNNDREFSEGWPSSRYNHYWFDLNRDWLWVQHPESQARIKTFQKWKPNVLGDFHEMGTNVTYFFQPGIAERTHPLTPDMNQKLTAQMAGYHSKALDKIGSLYYSGESFDDFYYGKGSTYPDINGAVGILFEQASSRGHAQESVNGVVTFPFTIKNQLTTSLSTLAAAQAMRKELLEYQFTFFKNRPKSESYIVGTREDTGKLKELLQVLDYHQIRYNALKEDIPLNGKKFKTQSSIYIPGSQENSALVQAMFDKRTSFKDSLFYDVSSWSIDAAFGLDFEKTKDSKWNSNTPFQLPITPTVAMSSYAYAFDWKHYRSPQLAMKLLASGVNLKVARKPFTYENQEFGYGSILIPVSIQAVEATQLHRLLQKLSDETGVPVSALSTGDTAGVQLGSPNFASLVAPKVAVLTGRGISASDAGEIWHLFDAKHRLPLTKINIEESGTINWNKYQVIIVPNGNYGNLSQRNSENLQRWVEQGGILIGYKNALKWFQENGLGNFTFKSQEREAKNISFEQRSNYNGAQQIGGAIFETQLDVTHPINYGFQNNTLSVFKSSTLMLEADKNSFNNPIVYTQKPLVSGYISKENLNQLKGCSYVKIQSRGSGRVIGFTENTQFRAFWLETERLLWNAI
ncbi:MAG: M14 family metallopeptidase, partial [Flavobacterium sp.]